KKNIRGDINKIIEDYENNTIKVPDILTKYNLTRRELTKIRKEYGIKSRKKVLKDDEIEEMLDMYINGIEISEILSKCKISLNTLHKYRRLHNISLRNRDEWDDELKSKINKYYNMGLENKDIAKLVGKDNNIKSFETTIYKRNVISPVRRKPVSKEIKEKILEEILLSSLTNKEISEKYKVSEALVSILKNKSK
ncbi:TPA: hypothetical protein I9082_002920, partial [Clostridium perfringens]|nr:hypothetical protein [Clostridium perfringens]